MRKLPNIWTNDRNRRRHGSGPPSIRARRPGWQGAIERLETRELMAADASVIPEAFDRFESIDEVKEFLIDKAVKQYADQFGQRIGWDYFRFTPFNDGVFPMSVDLRATNSESTSSNSVSFDSVGGSSNLYSTTNTQVEGVDEADVVETDGDYLYVLRDGELTITDVDPLEVTARYELDGYAIGEYLAGDRLTVITAQYHSWGLDPLFGRATFDALSFSPAIISKPSVTVTVLDVTDRTAPVLVEETKLDGNYVTSRAIGDKVFVVVGNSDLSLPPPQLICASSDTEGKTGDGADASVTTDLMIWPEGRWASPASDCSYEDRETYLARMNEKIDSILEGLLPQYSSRDESGEFLRGGNLHEPADIVRPLGQTTSQLLSVVSFDVFDDQTGPVAAEAIPTSWSSTLYASQDSLYVFQPEYDMWGNGETTKIVAFDWDVASGEIHAAAVGEVPGTPLNQFSADEFEGRLRVATTVREFNEFQVVSSSGVFVLERVGSTLSIVGSVTGIAPGETIRSVRFAGEQGYVVTFRQIDPFFTIDLSDPRDPTVVGELKIPGYSGYLQVLDATHVVGLGRVPGEQPWQWSLQVSLFDVSDLANPLRLGTFTFDDNVWGSIAEQTQLAFTWLPDLSLLAMPIDSSPYLQEILAAGGDESDQVSGLALLKLGLDPNATALPPVALETIVQQQGTRRGVRIGQRIYALSDREIVVVDALAPYSQTSRLELGGPVDGNISEVIAISDLLWFAVEPSSEMLTGQLNQPTIDHLLTPSPWDDPGLGDLLREATAKLAEHLGVTVDEIRLVTVESLPGAVGAGGSVNANEASRVVRLVLAVGDLKYLFAAQDGEVGELELVEDGYQFSEEPLTREWHNEPKPCDIDGDGIVAPLDGLIVINELNSKGPKSLRSDRPLRSIEVESRPQFALSTPPRYRFDSSGDGLMSPLDALLIINVLNDDSEPSESGEGEQTSADATFIAAAVPPAGALELASVVSLSHLPSVDVATADWNGKPAFTEIEQAAETDHANAFQDAAIQALTESSYLGEPSEDDLELASQLSGCAEIDSLFAAGI